MKNDLTSVSCMTDDDRELIDGMRAVVTLDRETGKEAELLELALRLITECIRLQVNFEAECAKAPAKDARVAPQAHTAMTREPKTHVVKCVSDQFEATAWRKKTCTFRINDRDYKVGDLLVKREIDAAGELTGRDISRRITHAVYGPAFGIPDGYVMLSLQ